MVAPLLTRTGACAIWSTLVQIADARARCCSPPSSRRPTGATTFCALSASATSTTVNDAAASRAGSRTTSISRVSLACTSVRPAPGTRAMAGFTTVMA